MSNITNLMEALKTEVNKITAEADADENGEVLSEILLDSIHKTMREIKLGAPSQDFKDLSIINFIIRADEAGYATSEIQKYVRRLKNPSYNDEEDE